MKSSKLIWLTVYLLLIKDNVNSQVYQLKIVHKASYITKKYTSHYLQCYFEGSMESLGLSQQ